MRKFTGDRLVVATHNTGKLEEISALLHPFAVAVTSAGELGLAEPAETETTFIGNARIKAHFAAQATGLPALADDSGICIDALDGAPGVYTADWAETPQGRDFVLAMTRAWTELEAGAAPLPRRAPRGDGRGRRRPRRRAGVWRSPRDWRWGSRGSAPGLGHGRRARRFGTAR